MAVLQNRKAAFFAFLKRDDAQLSEICQAARAVEIDMCRTCNHFSRMTKMIQLCHVPDALHQRLQARAALAGLSLSDFLVREFRKIAEQPTLEEMRERLTTCERYTGKLSPTRVLRERRDAH